MACRCRTPAGLLAGASLLRCHKLTCHVNAGSDIALPRHATTSDNDVMTCSLDRMLLTFAALWLLSSNASAHPVLKDNHDRTIVVRLQKGSAPNKLVVRVEYRLEVDEATVLLNDMRSFKDQVNPFDYANKLDYYAEFTKIYAPIYADRLIARIDKKPPADFRCDSHKARLQDDDGKSLGHLRCDFVFVAEVDISATSKVLFSFREQNYLLHKGLIALSLVNETERTIV